jgi:nitroreductase
MAIAMENMWLETTSLDLGGVWLGIAPNEDRMKQVKEILNLDDNLEPFSLFPIGYKAIEKKQADRFDLKRIHFDQ